MEATITLEYNDEKTAEAVASAVSPDNFKTPARLSINTFRSNNKVITEIKAEKKLATFIATIDDFLFCASTAERIVSIAKIIIRKAAST